MAEYIKEEGSLYRMFKFVDYPVFHAHIVLADPNDRIWAGVEGGKKICFV